jgi:hypothetical protein
VIDGAIANRDVDMVDLSLQATLGLHPRLFLRAYAQLYHAQTRNSHFQTLRWGPDRESLLVPDSAFANGEGDDSGVDLLVQALLRWELRHGTAATLVYNVDGATQGDPASPLDFGRALRRLGSRRQTHRLLLSSPTPGTSDSRLLAHSAAQPAAGAASGKRYSRKAWAPAERPDRRAEPRATSRRR